LELFWHIFEGKVISYSFLAVVFIQIDSNLIVKHVTLVMLTCLYSPISSWNCLASHLWNRNPNPKSKIRTEDDQCLTKMSTLMNKMIRIRFMLSLKASVFCSCLVQSSRLLYFTRI